MKELTEELMVHYFIYWSIILEKLLLIVMIFIIINIIEIIYLQSQKYGICFTVQSDDKNIPSKLGGSNSDGDDELWKYLLKRIFIVGCTIGLMWVGYYYISPILLEMITYFEFNTLLKAFTMERYTLTGTFETSEVSSAEVLTILNDYARTNPKTYWEIINQSEPRLQKDVMASVNMYNWLNFGDIAFKLTIIEADKDLNKHLCNILQKTMEMHERISEAIKQNT